MKKTIIFLVLTTALMLLIYTSKGLGLSTDEKKPGRTPQNPTTSAPGSIIDKDSKHPLPGGSHTNDNGKGNDAEGKHDGAPVPSRGNTGNSKGSSYLKHTITINEDGLKVVNNPNDLLVLVNKERNLPDYYIPSDLVYLDIPFAFESDSPVRYLRKIAAAALTQLLDAAAEEGIELVGKSGYRAYAIQAALYQQNVIRQGEKLASQFSAKAGQSEHQTGLAIDLTTVEMGYALEQHFEDTEAGQWLAANSHKFGFIIRFPKGKEDITGYSYEPWHLRYVGLDAANEIYESGLTLEEYLS